MKLTEYFAVNYNGKFIAMVYDKIGPLALRNLSFLRKIQSCH